MGTIVARWGLPKVAACQGVLPIVGFPDETNPAVGPWLRPKQVTAASMPRCSSVPMRCMQ